MKSNLFLFLFLTVFSLNVYAHGSAAANVFYDVPWTPVNISIFPLHLFSPSHTDVYGIYLSPGIIGIGKKVPHRGFVTESHNDFSLEISGS